MNSTIENDRLLRRREVEQQVGLCKSAIYLKIAEGTFPKPLRLSKRAVRWSSREISRFIEARRAERDAEDEPPMAAPSAPVPKASRRGRAAERDAAKPSQAA